MKTTNIILALALLLAVGTAIVLANNQEEKNIGSVVFIDTASNVIGTKVGTTTTGVDFSVIASSAGQSATTTYITKISHNWDTAVYSFKAVKASSTANMRFSFLGSNDTDCNTASSSTVLYDMVLTGDVNWFDIGSHIRDATYSASIAVGTSTLIWDNPAVATGRTVILTDLAYECLALQASGSSTQAFVQITSK